LNPVHTGVCQTLLSVVTSTEQIGMYRHLLKLLFLLLNQFELIEVNQLMSAIKKNKNKTKQKTLILNTTNAQAEY
jgi:hypothetical protein